jgi:hypothetical protein
MWRTLLANRGEVCYPIGSEHVKQSRYTPWRRLGERRYSSYSFPTSALDEGEWSASRPGRAFTPGERTPGTHCTGGWVGPRAGLDTEVKGKILCPCRGSNPGRPVVQPVVRHYTAWANPAPRKRARGWGKKAIKVFKRHVFYIYIACTRCG